MINRDSRCVFVANSVGHAHVVAAWLDERGVPAEVMNLATLGGLDGLTPFSPTGVSARGIEVCVRDESQVAMAQQLLEEFERERAAQMEARGEMPGVGVCEECGVRSVFPPEQAGTVQECPGCGSYVDVSGGPEAEESEEFDEAAEDGGEE